MWNLDRLLVSNHLYNIIILTSMYASLNELEIVEIDEREDQNDLEIKTTSVPNEEIAPLEEIALPSVEIAFPSIEIALSSAIPAWLELITLEPQASKSILFIRGRKRAINEQKQRLKIIKGNI